MVPLPVSLQSSKKVGTWKRADTNQRRVPLSLPQLNASGCSEIPWKSFPYLWQGWDRPDVAVLLGAARVCAFHTLVLAEWCGAAHCPVRTKGRLRCVSLCGGMEPFYTAVFILIPDIEKKESKWNKRILLYSIVSSCVVDTCNYAYNFFPSLSSTELHWKTNWKQKSTEMCWVQLSNDLHLRTLGQIFVSGEFSPVLFPL